MSNMSKSKLLLITYDHRLMRTGHPVRSAILKHQIGKSVVEWVTISESLLLYVSRYFGLDLDDFVLSRLGFLTFPPHRFDSPHDLVVLLFFFVSSAPAPITVCQSFCCCSYGCGPDQSGSAKLDRKSVV